MIIGEYKAKIKAVPELYCSQSSLIALMTHQGGSGERTSGYNIAGSPAQVFGEPNDVIGVSPAHLGQQLIRHFVKLLFEEAAVAIG